MRQMHAVITGDVQGVGYRAFVRREASALGVTGWVRNRADGTVEVCAEGDEPLLQRLEAVLRAGPPHAAVDEVAVTWGPAAGTGSSFAIRW